MKSRNQSRIASALSLLVGIWVVMSPIWVSLSGGALTSVIITGSIIIIASLAQFFVTSAVPSWIVGVAALWLLLSTVVFSLSASAGWSQVIAAVIGIAAAYWDGFEVTSLARDTGGRHNTGASAI